MDLQRGKQAQHRSRGTRRLCQPRCRQQGALGCGPNPAPPPVPRCKFPLGKCLKREARHPISAQQISEKGSRRHDHRNRIQRMFLVAGRSAALRCTPAWRNPARDFSSTSCFLEVSVSKGSQERSQESPAAVWHSWVRPSGSSEDRPVRAWVFSRLSREKFYLTVQMSIPQAICKKRFPSSLSKSW